MKKELECTSRIKRICDKVGVHYTNKTYYNIRLILKAYSLLKKDWDTIKDNVRKTDIKEASQALFSKMASDNKLSENDSIEYVAGALKAGYIDKIFSRSLEEVKRFNPDGKVFSSIIENIYFSSNRILDKEMENSLNLSHSAYQVCKKNAVMLFGVYYWKEVLKNWDNARYDIIEIERKLGRQGDFSSSFVDEE